MLLNWNQQPTAVLVAILLVPYLVFPWFLVVMVIGVDAVSGSRLESLTDGILSRPVTRHEYLLGSWLARVSLVLGIYVLTTVPAIVLVSLAKRGVADNAVTLYGILAALAVVALVLALQVSLGFLFGTLLRRPLAAIVVLLFLWYPVNAILDTFSLEEFSPISLSHALPTLLRQPWRAGEKSAAPTDLDLEAVAREMDHFLHAFGGEEPPPPRSTKFFERARRDEFSLLRVILGYGLPTLVSVGLATLSFCRRDL
jgi:hypothetical protein